MAAMAGSLLLILRARDMPKPQSRTAAPNAEESLGGDGDMREELVALSRTTSAARQEAKPLAARPTEPGVEFDQASFLLSLEPTTRRTINQARQSGALPEEDLLLLADEGAMKEFLRTWHETSELVHQCKNDRASLFKRYSQERYESGHYAETLLDESERTDDGGFRMDRFFKKNHPDEYCSTKMLYREGGGQIVRQVRVMPGEDLALDEATMTLRLAERLQCDALSSLLQRYRSTTRQETGGR